MDVIPPAVMVAGMIQIVLAVATIVLVFRSSPWAPYAAVVVGFVSAAGFTAAHLLPTWGFFSDSFINAPPAARVTWFSWTTAVFEIIADIVFDGLSYAQIAKTRIIDAGGSMDRFNAIAIAEYADLGTAQLVDLIRQRTQPRGYMGHSVARLAFSMP
ncbi:MULTISPECIES: hypothetical protein [unclassified Mycolicibacterium]|uniref:hypothetical protein n=1 Tax=unclassified Mycolicibacterium TaxID=2636767 RepID=UPI002EDBA6B1